MSWRERAMRRADLFSTWEDGLPLHSHDARTLAQDLKDALAEVERLREALRQVHALAEKSRADWPRHTAWGALVDIHEITKGMVE